MDVKGQMVIMDYGRVDDVINVSGHRMGTESRSALVSPLMLRKQQ